MHPRIELTVTRSAVISIMEGGVKVQMTDEPRETHAAGCSAPEPLVVPRIGELWPGQGGRLAGLTKDGFLILPTDKRAYFEGVSYGCSGKSIGATDEWDGPGNTKKMLAAGSPVAKLITDLEIEGHRDFYLLAKREAPVIYSSLREAFETDYYYLTSTEYSADVAWCQYFGFGDQFIIHKDTERRAFAVRRVPFSSLFIR